MSLPDNPNTLRETYYSVMAGQNDASILPDIETAPSTENRYLDYIARNGGGGGGDVTKAYVDEQDAKKTDKVTSAISGNFAGLDENGNLTDSGKKATDFATASDMTAVQGVIPSTATTQNKLATAADVTGEDITSTSTTSPLTDSADARAQGLTIYGRSEVVDGSIRSVGEGWATVDLGTINDWEYNTTSQLFYSSALVGSIHNNNTDINCYCSRYNSIIEYSNDPNTPSINQQSFDKSCNVGSTYQSSISNLLIRDSDYTDATAFKNSLNGVILCYQLADPTQGNTLAVKTDDGTGIDGTMATFTTALPLRGVSDTVRDKLICTADSKQVETVCGEVDLGTLTWSYEQAYQRFVARVNGMKSVNTRNAKLLCAIYQTISDGRSLPDVPDKSIYNTNAGGGNQDICIHDTDYTDPTTFKTAMSGVMLVYELAEPVTTPLTSAEISAFRGLRTYNNTTNVTITDEPDFEIDYLKNTNNGQAVADIQTDLQGQINGLAIKTLTYTGTGTATNSITFTEKPTLVLSIQITNKDPLNAACMPFRYGSPSMFCVYTNNQAPSVWNGTYTSRLTYSTDELTMTITGNDKGSAWNDETTNYTLYYI